MPVESSQLNIFDLVAEGAAAFSAAGLHFGHGTDNADDEALFLALHALDLGYDTPEARLRDDLDDAALARVRALFERRIETRQPAAYLTGRMWFAGLEFAVDERVLVPRSPIAELIGARLQPWLGARELSRALDIGTGSGCIALALAHAWPQLEVDATDTSAAALEVAQTNCERLGLSERVTLHCADLFPPRAMTYDLIVSNPPYVPDARAAELPAEYAAEPAGALFAGAAGLDCVARIMIAAADYLAPRGLLVLEVGEIWREVDARYVATGLTWAELDSGGEGVCVIEREALARWRARD